MDGNFAAYDDVFPLLETSRDHYRDSGLDVKQLDALIREYGCRVSRINTQLAPAGASMFDHVVLGVSNYAASKAFFLKALEPIGLAVVAEGPLGVELSANGESSLCIRKDGEKCGHLHLAFTAKNRHQVEAFCRAALEAGAKDNGAPGLRPDYTGQYYAAFVLGPDGHNIEVVCHESET